MRYAVKIQQENVAADNYAVMTFDCTAPNGGDKVAALVIALQATGCMAISRMLEITASNGAGPGTPVVPEVADVQAVLDAMDAASGLGPIPLSNAPILGTLRGQESQQLPLGTSLLVTETAVAGPKGRVYVPYATVGSLNAGLGRPKEEYLARLRTVFGAAYGIPDGVGTPLVPSFFVRSGQGNATTQSVIKGVTPSSSYAYLRSRNR